MVLYLVAASLVVPSTADAQFLKKLKQAATDAAEDEAVSQVDRMIDWSPVRNLPTVAQYPLVLIKAN
jgi:hypothetical protein